MLTPLFNINQDEDKIVIYIKAPYTKISDVDILCEGTCFCFHAKPYYLRLELPGEIKEEGSSCKYDVESGHYTVNAKKVEIGFQFQGLEFLTTLLTESKKEKRKTFLVEEIDESNDIDDAEIQFNWNENIEIINEGIVSYGYGFCNHKQNIITKLQDEGLDIVDIKNPENKSYSERTLLRTESENSKFDSDHYLADLFENDAILEKLHFKPWWNKQNEIEFSSFENDKLLHLPRRKYVLSNKENKLAYLGVVDILFAYAYNVRTNEDEENVESAWTIKTLSSCLSWCDFPNSLRNAMISCVRRSLSFPFYRNWELALKVLTDVYEICRSGIKSVLRCFLSIHTIFQACNSSPTYVLNDLFITDYCVWLQTQPDIHIKSLSEALKETKLSLGDCGLDLDVIEHAAKLTLLENVSDSETDRDDELDSDDDESSLSSSYSTESSSDEHSNASDVECVVLNNEISSLSLNES